MDSIPEARETTELWATLCDGKNGGRETRQEVTAITQTGNDGVMGQATGNDDGACTGPKIRGCYTG